MEEEKIEKEKKKKKKEKPEEKVEEKSEDKIEEKNVEKAEEKTTSTTTTVKTTTPRESKFTGGAFANFFIEFLTDFVSILTLGLLYPLMLCWHKEWEVSHTYINGRQLMFDGKALQLFGKYLLWLFLSVITFGIYYIFFMSVAMEKWETKHTHFVDARAGKFETAEDDNSSYFTGTALGLFGHKILSFLLKILIIGIPFAECMMEGWYVRHKVIDGVRITFDGNGLQLLGKKIVWLLLTIITFGIYSFWFKVKKKKWVVHHTHALAEGEEAPVKEIDYAKTAMYFSTFGIFVPVLLIVGIVMGIIALVKKSGDQKQAIGAIIVPIVIIVMIVVVYFGISSSMNSIISGYHPYPVE